MAGFVHRYAQYAYHTCAFEKDGEYFGDKLVVVANIPLRADVPGYDEAKEHELLHAAAKHANRLNVTLGFESLK